MTKWLHAHDFSYKKPASTPAKADPEQQKAFIDFYKKLLEEIPAEEPIEFGDGVHPRWQQRSLMDGLELGKISQFAQLPLEHALIYLVLLT